MLLRRPSPQQASPRPAAIRLQRHRRIPRPSRAQAMQEFFGLGSSPSAARCEGWQPESTFVVNSIRNYHRATIPFADRYLTFSYKLEQYLRWKDELERYVKERNVKWGYGRSRVQPPPATGKYARGASAAPTTSKPQAGSVRPAPSPAPQCLYSSEVRPFVVATDRGLID